VERVATTNTLVRRRRLGFALALEVGALLVALFVPFGFDHPSSWGLDFGHFLMLGAVFAAAWLYGLYLSIRLRLWLVLAGQVMVPVAFVVLAINGVLRI
jgi:hypothetical protein